MEKTIPEQMWRLLREAQQQLLGFRRFCGSAWPRPPIMPTWPHRYVSGAPGHAPAEALARWPVERSLSPAVSSETRSLTPAASLFPLSVFWSSPLSSSAWQARPRQPCAQRDGSCAGWSRPGVTFRLCFADTWISSSKQLCVSDSSGGARPV